jgi:hypothetical protein
LKVDIFKHFLTLGHVDTLHHGLVMAVKNVGFELKKTHQVFLLRPKLFVSQRRKAANRGQNLQIKTLADRNASPIRIETIYNGWISDAKTKDPIATLASNETAAFAISIFY